MPPLLLSFSCCHMFKGSSTRYKRGPLPPSIFSERHILRGWRWRGYYKVTHDYYYILTYIRYVVPFYNTSAAAGNELICKEKWARRAEPVKLWSLSFTSKVYKKRKFLMILIGKGGFPFSSTSKNLVLHSLEMRTSCGSWLVGTNKPGSCSELEASASGLNSGLGTFVLTARCHLLNT